MSTQSYTDSAFQTFSTATPFSKCQYIATYITFPDIRGVQNERNISFIIEYKFTKPATRPKSAHKPELQKRCTGLL